MSSKKNSKKSIALKAIGGIVLLIALGFIYVVININTHTYSDPSIPTSNKSHLSY